MNITPAERDVLMKYRWRGKQRAAVGGLLGASAMAGVWKMAKLGRPMGVTGMISTCVANDLLCYCATG